MLLFGTSHLIHGRHRGVTPTMWGLTLMPKAAVLTVHLALTIVTAILLTIVHLLYAFSCRFPLPFRRSLGGQTWLGPLMTCPLFVMMMLIINVCYIPLK